MTGIGYNPYTVNQGYPQGPVMQPNMGMPQQMPQMPMQMPQQVPNTPQYGQMSYNPGLAQQMIPNFNQQPQQIQIPMQMPNGGYYPQNGMTQMPVYNPSMQQMPNGMNAQMPAPNMQQNPDMPQNGQYQILPALNTGELQGPQNFSQTPILDDVNRHGQLMPQNKSMPQISGKKSKLTLGKVSAFCMAASGAIILTAILSKIIKLVHK